MRVSVRILGMLLLALFAASPSAMQLKMVVEERSPDGEVLGIQTILADKDHGINMEFQGGDQHGGMVWSKKQMIAWLMDFLEGTYWTMTEEDAARLKKMRQEMMPRMKAQQEKMKALFDEQMKGLSEEEKKAAMQHLPMGMGMGEEEEETVYEKVGSEAVDPWGDADIYVGRRYGEMVEKVWTAGWDQLGVDETYLQVFGDFGEFAGGFMEGEEGEQPFQFGQLEEEQGYPGFAVKRETYDRDGELESVEMTESVETQETDLTRYQLPITDPPLEEIDSPFDEMPDRPQMPPGY